MKTASVEATIRYLAPGNGSHRGWWLPRPMIFLAVCRSQTLSCLWRRATNCVAFVLNAHRDLRRVAELVTLGGTTSICVVAARVAAASSRLNSTNIV